MPVDRPLAEDLARHLAEMYADAQTRLAVDVARRLDSGMGLPDWADHKLQGLNTLRRFAGDLVQNLDTAMVDEVAQAMILAYVRGGTAALDDLARAQSRRVDWAVARSTDPSARLLAMIADRATGAAAKLAQARNAFPGADAVNRLAFSLVAKLRGTHLRIVRWDVDAYREVIGKVAPDVLLGVKTRRRAAQVAWERLLSDGITGFVDKAGRSWNLASYVEMATRTTVAQAAVEGHLDRLGAAGLDLVIVSNAPQECARCRPWEGKILARAGLPGPRTVQMEHATRDGVMITVHIAGTIDEAILAGLMHPNCRHSLSAYLPGVTKPPTNTEDPEGDKARQHLRALERKVRAEKLKAEAAIDPAAVAGHRAKVRATQAAIRDHVKATGLIRQPSRELIDLGNRPPPGPKTTPPAPAPTPAPRPELPAIAAKLPAMLDGELFDLWSSTEDDADVQDLIAAELTRRDVDRGDLVDDAAEFDAEASPDTDPLAAETLAELDDALAELDAERAAADVQADRVRLAEAAQAEREQAIDRLTARGWEYRDAYAEVYGHDPEQLAREERAAAIDVDRRAGETREQTVRRLYGDWVRLQYLQAETDTRGHMLTPAAEAKGVDPESLFSGPAHVARANASEDLLRWWADHGRQTYAEFRADMLGREADVQAAKQSRLQGNGQDFI